MSPCLEMEARAAEHHRTDTGLLHEVFLRSASRWQEKVALEIPPGQGRPARVVVTYGELNDDSDALAERLRSFVEGECLIGILLPRTSAHLYAAQLAVLKAGAAFTCLDPSFPDERVREILEDSGAALLLTDSIGLTRAQRCRLEGLTAIDLAGPWATWGESDEVAQKERNASWMTPASLAYVIYTSGTTGRPKGVMIEHRSIANLVASDLETFRLSPGDRVAQGSSAAYDSSIEETWLAFAAGGTLVVMDDEAVRLGPDLIPWLNRERISVFCPPPTLLRATGCATPETALPDLKLLYVGGEALPRDLADRWSRGRQLVNGYGPTECTVTCLRDRIREGEPVTIGRPIRGVKAWVLKEDLDAAAPGEQGELCVGGVGLARGYWRRPDLTSEKFIVHPRLGRLYRTGDLVHAEASGRFFYHGRIDAQVKLRGYRIELGEIESRLAHCAGVRAAVCCVQEEAGHPMLVAFIVPSDDLQPPSPDALKTSLAAELPDYMVPVRYGFLRELPVSVGGKLNRAALPHPGGKERPSDRSYVPPRHPVEAKIAAAFCQILQLPASVSLHDDFFRDLGGDSLRAARVITLLREDPETAVLAVRDLYEAPSVGELAKRAHQPPPVVSPPSRPHPEAQVRPLRATLIQTIWLLKSLVLGSLAAYATGFHLLPAITGAFGLVPMLLFGPPLLLAVLTLYAPAAVVLAVLTKKILIGRYRPLRAPVWGDFYLRNWMVQRAVRLIPWWLLEGTEFQNAALRALGARIGQRVHLHRGVNLLQGGWDLLEIGDDVTLNQDASLRLVEMDSGHLLLGPVKLGDGCTLDIHASVAGNTCVGPNAYLTARSALARGAVVPAGARWDGIPAQPAGLAPDAPNLPKGERVLSPLTAGLWSIFARLALLGVLAMPAELWAVSLALASGWSADSAMAWWLSPTLEPGLLMFCLSEAVLPVPLTLGVAALACRAMGSVREGVTSRWSPGYVRLWLKAVLLDSASRWLYGTLFWPAWLRLAGMKVGPGCELSTLIDTIPETVEIGAKTFCADGIYLAGPRIHRGTVTVARTRVGQNSFIGNGAVIATGQQLPDDILLGVCTVALNTPIRPGSSWFGHPAFELPRREVVAFDRRLTHEPTLGRYVVRLFWEALRFALPVAWGATIPIWFHVLASAQQALSGPMFFLVAVPLASFGAFIISPFLVIALKWALLGRARPAVHPLWSSWASRWDLFCLAWSLHAEEVVAALDGTLYLHALLRSVGMKIGRGVTIGHKVMQDLADPDMIVLEDGATVDCLFQAHTFEDRVLKMDKIIVRQRASVGRHAVLLYGADIGAGSRVSPNSVVMKQERLLANRGYAGFPVQQCGSNSW